MKNFYLFIFLFFVFTGAKAQVNLSQGLAAYYPFTGNANDISGNNNNPSFNNATLTADRFGNPNSAYHFDGVDNYMQIPNSPSLNFGTSMSICVWVRVTGFYTGTCYNDMLVGKLIADYQTGNYSLRFSDYDNGCLAAASTTDETFSAEPDGVHNSVIVQPNQWYSVVSTSDGTTSKVYVNCQLVSSTPITATTYSNTNDLFLGRLDDPTFPYWLNGDLDEVRLYNRAINQDEVNAYGGCATTCTQTSSMIDTTICQGQNFNGHTTTGTYLDTLTNVQGCDSLRTVNLTVNSCAAPICPLVNNIIINTGYDPVTKTELAAGQKDTHWTVTSMSSQMQNALCYNVNTTSPQGPPNSPTVPPVPLNAYTYVIPGLGGGISCFPVNTIYTAQPPPTPATGNYSYTMDIKRSFFINSSSSENVTFNFTTTCDDAVDSIVIDAGSPGQIVLLNTMTQTVGTGSPVNTNYTTSLSPGAHTISMQCADWEDPIGGIFFPVTVNGVTSQYQWNPFVVNIVGSISSVNNVLVNDSCCTTTTSTIDTTICLGQSFSGYDTTGTYIDTLANARGCDSIRTIHLIVNNCFPVSCNSWLSTTVEPDYVTVGDLAVSGNQLTVEGMFNRVAPIPGNNYYSEGDIISKHTDQGNCNYFLRPGYGAIATTNGYYETPQVCPFALNKTYQVALVYDGSTLKFYRDGLLKSQIAATGNLIQNGLTTQIGDRYGTEMDGYINEVRVWNVARPQDSIQTYMNSSLPNPTTIPGLLAYYTFNSLSNKQGNTAFDGTLSGAAFINATNSNCAFIRDSCCTQTSSTLDTTICQGQSFRGHTLTGAYQDTIPNVAGCDSIMALNLVVVNCTSNPTCSGSLGKPVVNITFGNGTNPGPALTAGTTTYTYAPVTGTPPAVVNDGEYSIVNEVPSNPSPGWFTGATDHTGDPNGYMAFFNASASPGIFYQQNITGLCAGTTYQFAAWIANVNSVNPAATALPNVTFELLNPVTDSILGEINTGDIANPVSMTWSQYGLLFTMPAGLNSVKLVLINNNAGGSGNDLAIDDITFSACGPQTIASFSGSMADTVCQNTSVNLSGTVSAGLTTPAYQWQSSSDNGVTFTSIAGATNLNYTQTGLPGGKYEFQLLSGEAGNINSSSCRFISNIINLLVNPPADTTIITSICQGQNYLGHTNTGTFVDTLIGAAINGCDSIRTLKLTVNLPSSSTIDTSICQGQNYLGHTSTGSYTDIMPNAAGCDSTITSNITVNAVPTVITNNDTSFCIGSSMQINTTGATTYSWSPTTGLTFPNNSSDPVAKPAGSIQYVVTGTTNGCAANDTLTITVNPLPVVTVSTNALICKNTSTQLSAGGGNSYQWTPAVTLNNAAIATPIASPVTNTIYHVLVTDLNNCVNTDSVKVAIRPDPVFSVMPDTTVCSYTPVQLRASGGDIYLWQPSTALNNAAISDPVATLTTSTTYTVYIKENTCGNFTNLTTTLTALPGVIVTAGKSNDLDCYTSSATLSATGADEYLWSPATALNNVNVADPIAKPFSTQQYVVKGTDANGCFGFDSVTVFGNYTDRLVYNMANAFSPNNDGINDCYGIKYFGVISDFTFMIFNRWGQQMFSTSDPAACWDGTFQGQNVAIGTYVYYIRAVTACGITEKKGTVVLIR